MILNNTLTKSQAEAVFLQQNRIAKAVIYLKKLDKRMIYRMGTNEDNRITRLRYNEDSRPQTNVNKVTGYIVHKRNEIITYAQNKELYVLGKSGGVSLFDAMSPKLSLRKNDCWYFLSETAVIPDGILIAKDVTPDENGHFHYAFYPAYDMKLSEFMAKLAKIGRQMKKI